MHSVSARTSGRRSRGGARKKRSGAGVSPVDSRRADRWFALLLFTAALVARLLFWRATPDRDWPYTAYFKGDAPVWLEYASALQRGESFELGLPIHPPGAGYLIALVWNGQPSGIPFLRFIWCLLGAATVVIAYSAAGRSFGPAVGYLAGAFAAASTGLLLLSTSLNNETPYLFLACASLWLFEDLRQSPRWTRLAVWCALNGVACLFRVEHLLFFLLMLAFLAVLWWRAEGQASGRPGPVRRLAPVAVSIGFFLLPLLPWHLKSWAAIERFNVQLRRLAPVEESAVRGVEEAASGISWNAEAQRKREELPGFVRRTGAAFVLATVAYRGGRELRGEDFRILEEAFGYFPRPLASFPFVSSYGPLNFYLANHPGATGGFDRSPLEKPPPLTGGAERFPPFLVQGLPPEQLSFVYPAHLRLFNEGYSLAGRWIADHPGEFARLAARKLAIFWSGAALGCTGYNLPLGPSGLRRSVDLVVPESGGITTVWRVAILGICVLGLAAGWRRIALWPWLLFLASKIVVTVLFFGYARQGAAVIPVLALLSALAAERWLLARVPGSIEKRAMRLAAVFLLLAVGVEAVRSLDKPAVYLDGRAVGEVDPFPPHHHEDQRINFR
jgi:hypothetical protein